MNQELKDIYKHMLKLGMSALTHANWHANYYSMENDMWSELSVLQAVHAAEILIKARISQEHPLLIFDKIPHSTKLENDFLNFEHLLEKGKTIQYSDLPERLWATTGIRLKNLELFNEFGMLRNKIQHFASPKNIDCGTETLKFIFEIIDPFINECWNLYAIDCNEDHEPYIYLIEGLIRSEITFLVSPDSVEHLKYVNFEWTENQTYKDNMTQRFLKAGYNYSEKDNKTLERNS